MAVSVAQVLKMDVLRQCRILAGAQHLDRPVEHINVLEVFVDGDEDLDIRNHLLLTTFAFTSSDSARQAVLVDLLGRAGCAAILFQEGVVAPLAEIVLAAAERQGMPLIEVPATVLYHQIIEPLASVLLHDDSYRLQHALAVHRRLAAAALVSADLPALLDCIAALLGRAVAVVGRLEDRIGASTGWADRAAPAIERLLHLDSLTRIDDGWVLPLRGAEWLVVAARDAQDELSPLDHTTLDEVGGAVALEVYRRRAIDQAGRKQHEDLLESLLSTADVASVQALSGRLTKAGWVLNVRTRVVRLGLVADGEPPDPGPNHLDDAMANERERAIRLAVDVLALEDPKAPVALFRGDAAYLPADLDDSAASDARLRARVMRVLERVRDVGPHWRWRVGAGDAPADSESINLAGSLAQADRAIAMSASLPELGAFVQFQQVAMPALLLELSGRADVRRWQSRMLGALLQAAAERADLIHTLDVFLDTGNSHKQTARLLGIHPKTLKYRLERIEEMLGEDVWRAEQRLSLHLAVKLARLNK